MTSLFDHRVSWLLDMTGNELAQALGKFDSFNSPHEGWAVIREELDELWDHVKGNTARGVLAQDEAIQICRISGASDVLGAEAVNGGTQTTLTPRQAVALGFLERGRDASRGEFDPHGYVISEPSFYDAEIHQAAIHWRTARALERRGMVPPDGRHRSRATRLRGFHRPETRVVPAFKHSP